MSNLTSLEKRKLEQFLGMETGYVLNFSNRSFDIPPRAVTAFCKPPLGFAMSLRKTNTSSKLDLPEAFGPTTKTLGPSSTLTERKFRQFFRISVVTSIGFP